MAGGEPRAGGVREKQAWITDEKLRTDTTAYEVAIHCPTDFSLLWDSFRVLARVLWRIQQELPALGLKHRYHEKKVKKLTFYIARNAKSTSKRTQRKVKAIYRNLIERVRWILDVSRDVQQLLDLAFFEVPVTLCHFSMGNWLAIRVERRLWRSSRSSRTSRRCSSVRLASPQSSMTSRSIRA